MSGGGKTSEKSVTIDPDLQEEAKKAFAHAQQVAQMGYQPNRGVTIAAFTPQQLQGMEGANTASAAFGMPTSPIMGGLPAPEISAGGIPGYSIGADYDDMVNKLPPAYRDYLNSFFIDPNTGLPGSRAPGAGPQGVAGANPSIPGGGGDPLGFARAPGGDTYWNIGNGYDPMMRGG